MYAGEYLGLKRRNNRRLEKLHNEELYNLYTLPSVIR
jgi:hypothetical protein